MDKIEHLTEATVGAALSRPGITVIDFWAGWRGPCRAMAPQLERAAALRPQYHFAKVDVEAEPAVAAAYGIRSIPTLMVLLDGEPVAAQAGAVRTRRFDDVAFSAARPIHTVSVGPRAARRRRSDGGGRT